MEKIHKKLVPRHNELKLFLEVAKPIKSKVIYLGFKIYLFYHWKDQTPTRIDI